MKHTQQRRGKYQHHYHRYEKTTQIEPQEEQQHEEQEEEEEWITTRRVIFREEGMETYQMIERGDPLSLSKLKITEKDEMSEAEASALGRALALTKNSSVNVLAMSQKHWRCSVLAE